jgi:hypothetical protein
MSAPVQVSRLAKALEKSERRAWHGRHLPRTTIGGLLMSGRRPNCDPGEPNLWSNGSVFMGPREPISIDPSPHILLQQTTAMAAYTVIEPPSLSNHDPRPPNATVIR